VHRGINFYKVPLRTREASVVVEGGAIVRKRASLLCGAAHMRGVRKHMKVKFGPCPQKGTNARDARSISMRNLESAAPTVDFDTHTVGV
jgi:hypothetical protein